MLQAIYRSNFIGPIYGSSGYLDTSLLKIYTPYMNIPTKLRS